MSSLHNRSQFHSFSAKQEEMKKNNSRPSWNEKLMFQFNRLQNNGRCDKRKINKITTERTCDSTWFLSSSVSVYTCNQFAPMAVLFPVVQFMALEENCFSSIPDKKKNEQNLKDADVSQTFCENWFLEEGAEVKLQHACVGEIIRRESISWCDRKLLVNGNKSVVNSSIWRHQLNE